MKKILIVLVAVCSFLPKIQMAQTNNTIPRLEKTAISTSGTFAYLPKTDAAKVFDISYSQDSAKVYTGDFLVDKYHFGIIVVQMKDDDEEMSAEDKADLITSYLDYLKQALQIKESAGEGKGHTMESNPKAVGSIDYWLDEEKNHWAIKAWNDGHTMAVLMLYGPADYPIFNIQQMFLDGFRFK